MPDNDINENFATNSHTLIMFHFALMLSVFLCSLAIVRSSFHIPRA